MIIRKGATLLVGAGSYVNNGLIRLDGFRAATAVRITGGAGASTGAVGFGLGIGTPEGGLKRAPIESEVWENTMSDYDSIICINDRK